MGKIIDTWRKSRRWIARGAKRQPPEQNLQMLISNVVRTCNNKNGRRMLLIPSLIGALIAPLCILTTAAGAIPASSSPTECWVATAPPAGFYIAAILSPTPGCLGHYRWKLGVAAAGVAECWVTTAPPPAGFYIAAILGASPGCLGHYRWKLDVAASPSPSPSTSPTLGLTVARPSRRTRSSS
jgi:hypothetical protein